METTNSMEADSIADNTWLDGWFDGYLTAIIGVSVFGGQITFSVALSDIPDPAEVIPSPPYQRQTVRTFVTISWLLFMFTLAIALFVKMIVSDNATRYWIRAIFGVGGLRRIIAATIILLQELPIAAFLFLALSITAYVPIVGWVGVGSISCFAVFIGVLWFRLWCL